jgi:lactate dehydrogenase-like 2-hydroxyacid dehydrogenase
MKPTAVLVNTARGAIVDEAALIEALSERRIFAAGLDVYETEPLPAGSPLRRLPNVVLLPHIGSATVRTRTRMALLAVENLVAALSGERPPCLVDPEGGS